MRIAPVLAITLLLEGCQLALPGRSADMPKVNPIAGDAIAVTPLDAPSPKPRPVAVDTPGPVADTPAAEPGIEPAEPLQPKSAEQVACDRQGGTWVRAGKTGTMLCLQTTRDSGKQCSKGTDCQGMCLARSGTCAPVTPLFGCNDILQDNGQRVTLCID